MLSPRQTSLLRWLGRWALRAIGPALLAVLLVRVVDFGELRAIIGEITISWAVVTVAWWQVVILLQSVRWMELHHALGLQRAPLTYQLRLTYATSLATLVLPQIVNPFSRFVLLIQDGYRARPAAIGAVLEKAFELAAFLSFGIFGTIFLASTFGALVWWAVGAGVVAIGLGVAAYAARSQLKRLIAALIPRLPGLRGRGPDSVTGILEELRALNIRVVARLSVWSLLIALAQATTLYFLSRSLGVGLSYPFMLAVWGVIALTTLLPLSVSGIGTREAVLVVAFSAADKSTDAAVALGLLLLAVRALGSAPGAVEWLRRLVLGTGRPVAAEAAQTTPVTPPPAVHPQGERGP